MYIVLASRVGPFDLISPASRMKSFDFTPLDIKDLYAIDTTICNPNWSLHFEHIPMNGFANSFRALRGIVTLALMFNASVTSRDSSTSSSVATWKSYCSELDESLSCICRNSSNTVSTDYGTRVDNIYQFYDDALDKRITNGTYIIKCYYDAYTHFQSQKGLVALRESSLVGATETWTDAIIRMSRLLFKPNKRIFDLVSPYRKKPNSIQLGVQIRTGGKLANSKEAAVFLDDSSMPIILSTINDQLRKLPATTELYISSDSDIMIRRIVQEYSNRKVHYLNCTSRGHSEKSISGLECGLMDIVLISESDYLIYTKGSSFGFLISNLMGLTTVPTIPSKVRWAANSNTTSNPVPSI